MNTQKNNSSQYKEVNRRIKSTLYIIRNLHHQIEALQELKDINIEDLKVLLNERKEIKESQELIKKSKSWNQ